MTRSTTATVSIGWETRLYPGLHLSTLPQEAGDTLAQALGTLGVEAEYFLELARSLVEPAGPAGTARERGERFLLAAEASARRLLALAQPLELATQAYLSEMQRPFSGGKSVLPDDGDVWWHTAKEEFALGEPLELSLRRCGFSYRHCVTARLAPNVEAIGEYLHEAGIAVDNRYPKPGLGALRGSLRSRLRVASLTRHRGAL